MATREVLVNPAITFEEPIFYYLFDSKSYTLLQRTVNLLQRTMFFLFYTFSDSKK